MNKSITRLHRIAAKKSRLIIGLMSGTSMDGLDVALCKISGEGLNTKAKLVAFETLPYSDEVKADIMEVFAKKNVDFEKLSLIHVSIGLLHAKMILQCLKKWKYAARQIDAIASHGQTVLHSPAFLHPQQKVNATFQVGDGDHIAVTTGIITLSDFRQKHVAKGGEGAPLAVYGDYLLLSHIKENRILLNIGGIANFTYLPAGQHAAQVFVTDTGPGNTLIDQAVRYYCPGEYYDKDAARASSGTVHALLLKELKADVFFKKSFPKTTGPELFNMEYVKHAQERAQAKDMTLSDLLATLTRFSAETIAAAVKKACGKAKFEVYLSGGGAHNPLLTQWIKELLNLPHLRTTADIGVAGDAKEAVLFAVLANESLAGGKINFGQRAKIPSVCMGKFSFPE